MLSLMRKHATSWIIKVALFLIIIVFIFWGGYSYTARRASLIAKVNKDYITINEYNKAYDNLVESYRRRFGGNLSDKLLESLNLRKKTLDMLIERHLLASVVRKLGLMPTAEEIRRSIENYQIFKTNGRFDPQKYELILRRVHLSPEAFESQQSLELALNKLQRIVTRNAKVSDKEVSDYFHFNQDEVKVSYVLVDPKKFTVKDDPEKIKEFFENNKERYREPEKRKFDLVLFRYSDFEKQVKPTEGEIKFYYDEHKRDFYEEKKVRARHILFKIPPRASREEIEKVRKRAEKVLKMAREGKDFAELAKKYSEDPGSAKNGGDLGFFTYKMMVKPFSEAAFSLKPGQISGLVRSPYGFHIIKVEEVKEAKTLPLKAVKGKIIKKLKEQRAKDLAQEAAGDFADLAFSMESVEKAAREKKLAVASSGLVKETDPLPLLGRQPGISRKLFSLDEKEVSQPLETRDGLVVAQVMEIREPEIPDFKAVRDKVKKDWENEELKKLAEEKAREILDAWKQGKKISEIVKKENLTFKETDWFSRKKPYSEFAGNIGLFESIFSRNKNNPFPDQPIEVGGKWVVFKVTGWKPATGDKLKKEREKIYGILLAQKRQILWNAWVEQMKAEADIEILKDEFK